MSVFAKLIDPAHKRMSRMVGYALALDSAEGWQAFAALASSRLSDRERTCLAWAALSALDRDHARTVAEHCLDGAVAPVAPLFDFIDEAAFWADLADPDEIEAYCLATFNRMPPRRQADFLSYVQGRDAA